MANTKITTNVIADDAVTSDKLGGDLTMPGHVSLADNKELRIGTGNDLVIKHDGSHTTLTNTTGNLILAGGTVYIANAANNEYMAQFVADGAASLRFNNVEELATISGGIYIPNKLGIGTNSPTAWYADDLVISVPDEGGITIASSATSYRGILAFADASSGDGRYAGYVAYDHNTDGMTFHSGGVGAKRVEIDSVGTLKVGAVVPTPGSGWDANLDAIQVGEASAFRSGDSDYSAATVMSTNIYQTGGGDKLLNGTDYAAQYAQQGGNHYFYGYNNGSADATPAVAANDLANPLIIHKGGGLSIGGGAITNTVNGKAGIFWHGNPTNGADYCIRRTNDAWSGSNYAQLLLDWDTGVKIDVGNSAYGKSYLEVNGNVKFSAAGQGIDFSAQQGSGAASGNPPGTTTGNSLLDDYEEGTFTAELRGQTVAGSFTHVLRQGRYTKVGNAVNVVMTIYYSGTSTSPTGTMEIKLPFNSSSGNTQHSFYIGWAQNITFNGTQLAAYLGGGGNTLILRSIASGGTGGVVTGGAMGSAAYLMISGTYYI